MANNAYYATALIGGASGALDELDGNGLTDGDVAITVTAERVYIHWLDADSAAAESSPDVVSPDTNAGNKRWILRPLGELDIANEWTTQQNFNELAITSTSNATAWNLDTAQCAVHTLTENTTISAPTNMNAGGVYQLRVVQAAGLYTLAWNAAFDWGAQATPAEPAASADEVVFSFYSDGTNMYGIEMCRSEA
jgi:hypothetical protein